MYTRRTALHFPDLIYLCQCVSQMVLWGFDVAIGQNDGKLSPSLQ